MHDYRNARAYASAQWAWDNMADDFDSPAECDECHGTGSVLATDENSGTTADERFPDDQIECDACQGTGWLDCDGEPCEAPK